MYEHIFECFLSSLSSPPQCKEANNWRDIGELIQYAVSYRHIVYTFGGVPCACVHILSFICVYCL